MATERNAPTDDAPDLDDVDGRVAALYGGPLAEFVAQRDAMARSLRAAGRRDEATRIKSLKKPKALAWALDAGAHARPAALAELTAAVEDVSEAQSSGGDVRTALARLRAAETALLTAAGDATTGQGHPVDATALAAGLRAVVGDPHALAALGAGQLVDVPGTGGFGLAAPPATAGSGSRARDTRGTTARRSSGPRSGREATEVDAAAVAVAAARRELADAEQVAAAAAADARAAAGAADEAEADARAAEDDAVAARRRADAAAEAARQARAEAEQRAARQAEADADLAAAQDTLRSIGT